MKGLRGWLLYGVLLAVAAAAAIASRQAPSGPSGASVDDAGPSGLRALFLYLQEGGYPVEALREPLAALPADARTLVIAAPEARELEAEELAAVQRFVEGGGTLVYLAPRPIGRRQPGLDHWLGLQRGALLRPAPLAAGAGVEDLAGATAKVWLPMGVAAETSGLRVAADEGLSTTEGWAPVAGAGEAIAVWWRRVGSGQVWALAGADLAENRRLELLDNLRFWENIAATGLLVFDEFHHRPAPPPPVSRGLSAFALQLLACALFFAYARGTRFGPPRPEHVERHRSSLEYVRSIAWLTRRARVEGELLAELAQRLRSILHDRLGIALSLGEPEVARELAARCRIPEEHYLSVMAELRRALERPEVSPREYLRLSRALAEIERVATGRAEKAG